MNQKWSVIIEWKTGNKVVTGPYESQTQAEEAVQNIKTVNQEVKSIAAVHVYGYHVEERLVYEEHTILE